MNLESRVEKAIYYTKSSPTHLLIHYEVYRNMFNKYHPTQIGIQSANHGDIIAWQRLLLLVKDGLDIEVWKNDYIKAHICMLTLYYLYLTQSIHRRYIDLRHIIKLCLHMNPFLCFRECGEEFTYFNYSPSKEEFEDYRIKHPLNKEDKAAIQFLQDSISGEDNSKRLKKSPLDVLESLIFNILPKELDGDGKGQVEHLASDFLRGVGRNFTERLDTEESKIELIRRKVEIWLKSPVRSPFGQTSLSHIVVDL